MDTPQAALHLLLAREDGQPALPQGVSQEAILEPPRLGRNREVNRLARPGIDLNNLQVQRWGLVAPLGPEGDELLDAVAPLLEHRQRQQGHPVKVYRAPTLSEPQQARQWYSTTYLDEKVPTQDRPLYLLLLGGPHQLSLELQQVLAQRALVGRLGFHHPSGQPDLSAYRAYVDKVLASEARSDSPEAAEVLLYTAQDGSKAIDMASRLLMEPCQEALQQWKADSLARALRSLPAAGEEASALVGAAATHAALLFSVAHGLGLPVGPGVSPEGQRARQGVLSLAPGHTLEAEALRSTPFLPEGVWLCFSCFGAATPHRSAFHPWLEELALRSGGSMAPQNVLQYLPPTGEPPFLAAPPQAALANPQGPLAFIGHCDLAWMHSFTEPDNPFQSRASRFIDTLGALARGCRAGVALNVLLESYRDVNESLMADYQSREEASAFGTPDPVDPLLHASRWMLRNDLRGYLLLGDPAVRLPLRRPVP